MPTPKPAYKRILLKISGESFLGDVTTGIDFERAVAVAREIKEVHDLGVDVAVMIGGGNLFRGARGIKDGIDQGSADQMGMLATVINGIALQAALDKAGADTRHVSAIEIKSVAEPFIRRRVIRHMEKGRIIIFSAGIGCPYFTTDTAAAQRALEIGADIIFKATKVDGVYSSDPVTDKAAKRFKAIRYIDVLKKNLKVMDATAISLCSDNGMPILVFALGQGGNIRRAVMGETIGTRVY
ncbi:MAG: UMP kinase [Candidatus Aminicenantales bacterium]